MKFVIISNFLPLLSNFRGVLINEIYQRGFEIHIIAPNLDDYEQEVKELILKGYYLHNIPLQRTGVNVIEDLKTIIAIYKILNKLQADYVLSYTIKPIIYGSIASWLAKIPHRFALITGLGYAFQNVEMGKKRSFFQKIVHQLYAIALDKVEKVFFQNPDDKKLFLQLGLLKVDKPCVVVNGSGVNVKEFSVVELPMNDLGEEKISFLLIARLLIDKGIREYIQAARKIKKEYPYVEFNLVGWIDENPSAISPQELDEWIQEGIINYWGKQADVRPAIANSSIYVLPSYREGVPRSVLEAMSMGRAIITTNAPGCKETVIPGENGFLIEVKSVDALIEAMERFIKEPALIKDMGKKSRLFALDRYDVDKVNRHMLKEMGIIPVE